MEWVEIVVVRDFGEAEIIRSLLAVEGIPIMIRDEEVARIFPNVLGDIKILVPEDQAEKARDELRSIRELGADDLCGFETEE